MMYTPFNYEAINTIVSQYRPSAVKTHNNVSFEFWERALFQRACSVIKLDVPWTGNHKNFLMYCLMKFGYVAVFDNPEYGFAFQPCALSGYNFYYQPTDALISNPMYNETLKIGTECELLQLTPDYFGAWDIVSYYAEQLADMSKAIKVSITNNITPNILGAKNKSASQALKKVIDLINSGEPTVIYDKIIESDSPDASPFESLMREHVKDSYITTDQLRDFQTILNAFDTEIGIPTIPYEKKERMVTSEADSRIIDSQSRATVWLECLNNSIDVINKHYNTSLSASLRYDTTKEVTANE